MSLDDLLVTLLTHDMGEYRHRGGFLAALSLGVIKRCTTYAYDGGGMTPWR